MHFMIGSYSGCSTGFNECKESFVHSNLVQYYHYLTKCLVPLLNIEIWTTGLLYMDVILLRLSNTML